METERNNMQTQVSKQEGHCSIDDIALTSKRWRLDSPRSIEACFRLGIDYKELFFVSFKRFTELNPDIATLPSDLQHYRYDHFERYRASCIQMIKDERNKLIGDNRSDKSANSSKAKDASSCASSIEKRMESLIDEEKRAIEKIKNKQKMEIQSLIESQVKAEMMRQASETKEIRMKEKEQRRKEENRKKMKEMEEVKKSKDEARQNELNRKTEEQKQRLLNKIEREYKRLNDLKEQERRKNEELQKKYQEEQMRMSHNRGQLELYFKSQEEEANKKRQKQEEKEREQQEGKERKRQERMKLLELKKEKAERRLQERRHQANLQLSRIRSSIEKKRRSNEKKLDELYRQRDLSVREMRERSEKRFNDLQFSMRKCEEMEEKKKKKYFERQDKIGQAVFLNEINRTEKIKLKSLLYQEISNKNIEKRSMLSKEDDKRKKDLLDHMEEIDKRVLTQKRLEEREMLERQEENNVKSFEKAKAIERAKRIVDYRNKIKMDELEEKERKLEEYKQQQLKMSLAKAQMSSGIHKDKEAIVAKFDKILRGKAQMNFDTVRQLFPGDEELLVKIKTMQKGLYKYKSFSESNTSRAKSVRPSHGEKEIAKKVEEFRVLLRENLNKQIKEEKEREEKRVSVYEAERNAVEKQRLEKLYAKERAESNQRVLLLQNEMEKKVKMYEDKVRRENMFNPN